MQKEEPVVVDNGSKNTPDSASADKAQASSRPPLKRSPASSREEDVPGSNGVRHTVVRKPLGGRQLVGRSMRMVRKKRDYGKSATD